MISDVDFLRIYDIKKLDERFSVSDFDCGDEDLNGFIRNEALFYREQLLAMPYVLTEKDRIDRIWAYFTLANDKISVTDFPSNSQFNKFKKENFKKEKFLRSYPSVKVGRLAISKDLQGQGIGTHLLRFIKMYFATDNKTGCRFCFFAESVLFVPVKRRCAYHAHYPISSVRARNPTRIR